MKKIIKRVLKNVKKRAFGELNNIFQDAFIKVLFSIVNECQILFYRVTESRELKYKIRFQNILIRPCRSAMFWNFCVVMYCALTYDVMKSYLTRV